MSRKKFDAGWYAGSVREAKRGAYLAGAEAVLDISMKTMDAVHKKILKSDEPMPDSVRKLLAELQYQISQKLYNDAISTVFVKTPFDPPEENSGPAPSTE